MAARLRSVKGFEGLPRTGRRDACRLFARISGLAIIAVALTHVPLLPIPPVLMCCGIGLLAVAEARRIGRYMPAVLALTTGAGWALWFEILTLEAERGQMSFTPVHSAMQRFELSAAFTLIEVAVLCAAVGIYALALRRAKTAAQA